MSSMFAKIENGKKDKESTVDLNCSLQDAGAAAQPRVPNRWNHFQINCQLKAVTSNGDSCVVNKLHEFIKGLLKKEKDGFCSLI